MTAYKQPSNLKISKVQRILLYEKYLTYGFKKAHEQIAEHLPVEEEAFMYLVKNCKPYYIEYQKMLKEKKNSYNPNSFNKNQPYFATEKELIDSHKITYDGSYFSYQQLSPSEKKLFNTPNMDSILHDACQPYDFDKDLCNAYNRHMRLLPNTEDWAIFIDHDAIWTTYDWKKIIAQYIERYPEYSCFTCLTNRIGNPRQLAEGAPTCNDYAKHREFGKLLATAPEFVLEDFTHPTPNHLSGVVIVLHKSAWQQIGGFKPWSQNSNILGVDSALHRDLEAHNLKTGIMKNLYVYHWYRGGSKDKSHLQ